MRLSKDISLMSEGAEETAELYHVSNYPTSVVIGPTRTVRAYGHPHDAEGLRSLLDQSLNYADALSIYSIFDFDVQVQLAYARGTVPRP